MKLSTLVSFNKSIAKSFCELKTSLEDLRKGPLTQYLTDRNIQAGRRIAEGTVNAAPATIGKIAMETNPIGMAIGTAQDAYNLATSKNWKEGARNALLLGTRFLPGFLGKVTEGVQVAKPIAQQAAKRSISSVLRKMPVEPLAPEAPEAFGIEIGKKAEYLSRYLPKEVIKEPAKEAAKVSNIAAEPFKDEKLTHISGIKPL